ncbi:MAG: carbohydrate ABC transporter permease [Clostridium sp.]|nr:carbohydrate ABC transporter permease [Clostridium sp.]MCM1547429.1 carbohydrate ABC transporter permease [Ruminococcus sp.]
MSNKVKDNYNAKLRTQSIILFIVCVILSLICIVPIYILVINSTRTHVDIINTVSFIPGNQLVRNVKELLTNDLYKFDPLIGFKNSAIIAIGGTVLSVFFSSLTAYGLVVYDYKLKGPAYVFILAVMMVPMQVTSVGFLQFMIKLGLNDSFIPLIVPTIAAPAIVFYMRQYLKTSFPQSIVEAARIDGCGEFRTFLTIAIPMMKPAIAVQSIFAFIQNWNNFYQPSMILTSRKFEQLTMPMMINALKSNDKIADYGVIYAGIALSIVPVVVIYLLLSRFIVAGVALGGVKE